MNEATMWGGGTPPIPTLQYHPSPITLRQPKIVQFTTASALERQRFLEQTTPKPTDNINIHDMNMDINLNALTKDELIDLLLLRRETSEAVKRDGGGGPQPAAGSGQQTGVESRAGEHSRWQCGRQVNCIVFQYNPMNHRNKRANAANASRTQRSPK
jgi:hypothetical protein